MNRDSLKKNLLLKKEQGEAVVKGNAGDTDKDFTVL